MSDPRSDAFNKENCTLRHHFPLAPIEIRQDFLSKNRAPMMGTTSPEHHHQSKGTDKEWERDASACPLAWPCHSASAEALMGTDTHPVNVLVVHYYCVCSTLFACPYHLRKVEKEKVA